MAKRVRLVSTAYGPPWGGIQGTGVTSAGIDLRAHPHQYVVAVDPRVIPIGTKLKIPHNPFGDPNIVFTAADTGGAIKGNRLDFFDWRGRKTQMAWGTRPIEAELLGHGNARHTQRAGASGPQGASGGPTAAPASPGVSGDPTAGPDLAALIQALQPVRQQPPATPPAQPSFAAQAVLPQGYQPVLSGPPQPPPQSITDKLLPLLSSLGGQGLPADAPAPVVSGSPVAPSVAGANAGKVYRSGSAVLGGAISRKHLGRVDQGVDFTGTGPIPAHGDGVVTRVVQRGGPSGWPGGGFVVYKLTSGPAKGRYVYVAENISPSVRVGQRVRAGQTIAVAHGGSPFLETGWAQDGNGTTSARARGHADLHPNHSNTPEGHDFLRFLGLA